jgi:hypothetical protein
MSKSIEFSSIPCLLNGADHTTAQTARYGPSATKYRFLTLAEASFLSQQPLETLVAEGESGSLTLFVRPPAGAAFRLYNERTGETADPASMRTPNILVLPPAACRELISWKQAQVRQASLAASLGTSVHGDHFRWLKPNDCHPTLSPGNHGGRFVPDQWTHWSITLPSGAPLDIEMSDLRVLKTEVERRFGLEAPKEAPKVPSYAQQLAAAILGDTARSPIAKLIADAVLAADDPRKPASVWVQLCSIVRVQKPTSLKFVSDMELKQPSGKNGWKPYSQEALGQFLRRYKPETGS